jgi:uncharacterized protein with HEPN domain
VTRGLDDLLADLAEAADAATELVRLGKKRWDTERPLRLAGEAVIGRLGDIATKLPDEVIEATPEIPWKQVKGMRIIAAHAYHRIDYEEVWVTLRDDVPRLDKAINRWRQTQDLYPRLSQVTTKVGRHGARMIGPTGSVLALRLRATLSGTLKSPDPVGWLAGWRGLHV